MVNDGPRLPIFSSFQSVPTELLWTATFLNIVKLPLKEQSKVMIKEVCKDKNI